MGVSLLDLSVGRRKLPDKANSNMDGASADSVMEQRPKPQVIYRCKKCRRIVAAEENIVSHKPGKGESCFKWNKRSRDLEKPADCASIFVEPMKWMESGEFSSYFTLMFSSVNNPMVSIVYQN